MIKYWRKSFLRPTLSVIVGDLKWPIDDRDVFACGCFQLLKVGVKGPKKISIQDMNVFEFFLHLQSFCVGENKKKTDED